VLQSRAARQTSVRPAAAAAAAAATATVTATAAVPRGSSLLLSCSQRTKAPCLFQASGPWPGFWHLCICICIYLLLQNLTSSRRAPSLPSHSSRLSQTTRPLANPALPASLPACQAPPSFIIFHQTFAHS
jgi:hypothetical protein